MRVGGVLRAHWLAVGVFAILVSGSTVASAADWAGSTWSGSYVGLKTAYDSLQVDYTEPGTPGQGLNGAMIGLAGGMDFQANSLVLGVAGDVEFGNITAFARDGNYITESGKANVIGTLRGRAGFAMGNWLPYITGGLAITSLEQGEICPDPAAVPNGFCRPALGHAPFDLKSSKTLVGGTFGGGIEVKMSEGMSIQAQYLHSIFPTTTYILSPDASGNPLPASEAHPTLDEGSLTFVKRF
jgi:opacity protein-like surface antigen